MSNAAARILIVEDEEPLAELLRYTFEREGFHVTTVYNGEEALSAVTETPPDLIVLDWILPGTSGLSVCRQVRRNSQAHSIPIIMVTARGEEADRVLGLEAGADDYVAKPFSPLELVARVRAVLRRAPPPRSNDELKAGDIAMNLATQKVVRCETPIHLGPTEFRMLRLFLERPGRVFTREQLLDRAWGHNVHVELRTVDVHIWRLRTALMENSGEDVIRTVRSIGYALEIGNEPTDRFESAKAKTKTAKTEPRQPPPGSCAPENCR